MHINIFNGKYQYYKFDYIEESWYIQDDLEKEMNNFAHITGRRFESNRNAELYSGFWQ